MASSLERSDQQAPATPADGGGTNSTCPETKRSEGLPAPPIRPAGLPDWLPAQLGGYRLLRELGHGGMGYVFEAEEERIQRRVAVKVLRPNLMERVDAALRFLREARAAAAVEHENVVPVLHAGEHAGMPFIVMPLLRGESLQQRLKREKVLPAAQVARIGADVSAALAAAHALGLVHRDLKPANVWLDEKTGRALVLDFGLARLGDGKDALTEPGVPMGTPAYMAPEQIEGRPPDPKADLFSLGATMYECAAGRRAFEGPTITALLKAVAEQHPPPPAKVNPQVPDALSELIVHLLAKRPSERPPSAAKVQAMFASLSTDSTISLPAPPPAASRLNRRRALIAGVLAAGVLASLGLYLATRPPPSSDRPSPQSKPVSGKDPAKPPAPIRYRGKVDVLVERGEKDAVRLLRLNEPGALPLMASDKFRIEGEVDAPAYLYVVWVDPDHDVTPVYPWDPRLGWGSRPAKEEPVEKISLPTNSGIRYTAPKARPGVATIILLARSTPLEAPDDVVKAWFEALPELPLPPGGDSAAVWFDDFAEVRDPLRLRTFGEIGSEDAFARWQGELQKTLGGQVSFQTAVSFARTGVR